MLNLSFCRSCEEWFFIFCLLTTFQYNSHAGSLPSIVWDPHNYMFDAVNCPNSNYLSVKYSDSISVVCSNANIINYVKSDNHKKNDVFYNLYVTSDKTVFEKRDAKKSRHLLDCDLQQAAKKDGNNAFLLIHYDISFSDGLGSSSAFEFYKGKRYYFFTTSDGSEENKDSTEVSPKSEHMYFVVYVCNNNELCEDREQKNVCRNTPFPLGFKADPSGKVITIEGILLGVLIGVFIMLLILCIAFFCHRRKKNHTKCAAGNTNGHHKEQKQMLQTNGGVNGHSNGDNNHHPPV